MRLNQLQTKSPHRGTILKRALQGAAIAFLLIGLFLLGINNPKPEWHRLWMLKPLIMVPLAGAAGGVGYYFLDNLRSRGGWKRALAELLSLLIYLIALWFGTILGLNGTLWN